MKVEYPWGKGKGLPRVLKAETKEELAEMNEVPVITGKRIGDRIAHLDTSGKPSAGYAHCGINSGTIPNKTFEGKRRKERTSSSRINRGDGE